MDINDQNLAQELSSKNKIILSYGNKIVIALAVLVFSSFILSLYALIFSFQKVYLPGQMGSVGQNGATGQTGNTGQNGTNGQNGPAGAIGAAGSFSTSGYHDETVCVRSNGQLDVFKSTHGGTGVCPSGDAEIVMLVKN